MIRTFAVLLLLLGLATATPVVCLCAPSEAAGLATGLTTRTDASGATPDAASTASNAADAPSLVATSAAAVVASLVAAAGGLRPMTPWRLPQPAPPRWLQPIDSSPVSPAWSPAVPPPR